MHVLSAVEMQACDQLTSEQFGVPSGELMRAAAEAVATLVREQFPRARRVTALCGRGNNGGDGMVAARLLIEMGLKVTTLLLGSPMGLTGDAANAWSELVNAGPASCFVVERAEELELHKDALAADLILDAVVGTGFNPPMKTLALAAVEWVKRSKAAVLAVDLPSGWPSDSAEAAVEGPVFPADAVITFTAPKPAHVFGQLTRRWDQPVVVAPIGSPEEAVVAVLSTSSPGVHWTGSAMALVQTPRAADANKGAFGHVLVVGGSTGKWGAPAMAALAALRAGAGLVTAAVPAPALAQVGGTAPELMTWPLAADPEGSISALNLAPDLLAGLLAKKTVLALGPGIGQAAETVEFVTKLLAGTTLPAVIDADALNILAAQPQLLAGLATKAQGGRTIVLTPHPGEMARLAGVSVRDVQANRLGVARWFAQRIGVTLVLKGARTVIAHPDGTVAVNTTGNPGMAKGGSGDLLTGLVAGLLAQHPGEPAQAVEAAVYLHGLAADLAVRDPGGTHDEHTLLATDSLPQLSRAFRFYSRGPNGYVWLQGMPRAESHAGAPDEAQE